MDQETDDGLTPVIIACQNGNAEQLKELLENGVCSLKNTSDSPILTNYSYLYMELHAVT